MADLRTTIIGWGTQAATGASLAVPLNMPARRIVVVGMGGSSVAGEMLSLVRDDVIVHWDAGLPTDTGAHDLVICVSWSGNTTETLAAYDAARTLGIPLAAITTGGALLERAQTDKVPVTLIPNPDQLRPRFGTGLMTGALFAMVGVADRLPQVDAAALEAPGKSLAETIGTKVPVFYASYANRKIAGWFKTLFNEDVKHHAWASNFPSSAHNEIEGWQGPYQESMLPVLVGSTGSNGKALVAILEPMGYTIANVDLPDDTVLATAFTGYILALWTSYWTAENLGVDPADTKWIDQFKQLKA